jgi:hypothetical protein
MHLVVARYNENLEWLKQLNLDKCSFTVYNKGESQSLPFPCIERTNIGREAETYLGHIIENYDNLNGYYVFCQGYPFDHVQRVLIGFEPSGFNTGKGDSSEVIRFFNTYEPCGSYMPLGPQYCCDMTGKPHMNYKFLINEVNIFFENYDKPNIWFVQGAQFLVSAECIKFRPKQFYERLMARSKQHIMGMDAYAHVLERLWGIIFNPYYRHRI